MAEEKNFVDFISDTLQPGGIELLNGLLFMIREAEAAGAVAAPAVLMAWFAGKGYPAVGKEDCRKILWIKQNALTGVHIDAY